MSEKPAEPIKSGRALAAALGVGETTIREYLARPDWPVSKVAPWKPADVETVRQWQAGLQENRNAPAAGGAAGDRAAGLLNNQLKLERVKILRAQRQRLERELVSRKYVDQVVEALARVFVRSLEELERSLPLQLAGRDAGQIEQILHQHIRTKREALAAQQAIELQKMDQDIAAEGLPKQRGRPPGR